MRGNQGGGKSSTSRKKADCSALQENWPLPVYSLVVKHAKPHETGWSKMVSLCENGNKCSQCTKVSTSNVPSFYSTAVKKANFKKEGEVEANTSQSVVYEDVCSLK